MAWTVGAAIAVPAGFAFARLLRPLREVGRVRRFLADLWAGWIATFIGVSIAVAIAGPYLLAHRNRSGRWYSDPYSYMMGMVISIPIGVIIAWGNWSDPLPRRPRLRRRIGAAVRQARRARRDA